MGIYVISVAQTWLGRSIFNPLSRLGIDLVILPWLACVRLGSDRSNAHLSHEPFDTLPVDLVSPAPQLVTDAACTQERMLYPTN